MARVLLIATGDTIAYMSGPGRPGVASGADLLRTVPARMLPAQVEVEDFMAPPSWDMSPSVMLALARRARSAILDEEFDGVVITHGLDAMEDTAYLTDVLAGPAAHRGAIVLTGAVRPLDDPSPDGPGNLAASLTAAAHPALRGVGAVVCLDDRLHAARWVTMIDAGGRPAFTSAPYSPVFRVEEGRIRPLAAAPPRPPDPVGEPESHVPLIKTYPDIEPALLTTVVDAGARGIVLEGTGAGNVPVTLFTAIAELSDWDIPVVVASRCHTSGVPLDTLPLGLGLAAKAGAIGARGLAPVKARAALMVALGSGGRDAVREWFARM
ncbi:asparaginase [Planotetraspora kaengkrachanensis]|uniref:asparaginase n=1 Tax=Planotetraspora kaengkrachanensis TaxID=575193 RepID=UPI00194384CD|nr:asparaginase [Planotetraspora kaengkrachanensis]